MGIGAGILDLLARLHREGLIHKHAAIAEIGAQQLSNNFLEARSELVRLGELFGIDGPLQLPNPEPTQIVHGKQAHLSETAPAARDFWSWLGFEYAAIDIDGSPGSIELDLNFDDVPRNLRGKFALVTNFGTTEHVANQLNAFKIIHELTALHGVMIHQVPAQGFFNHGLVNYNPKFFWMLARSNGYNWIEMTMDQDDEYYPLPENIMGSIKSPSSTIKKYRASDAGIQVIMQKVFDIPFVPPLDVSTGTTTNIDSLKKRYWTVFDDQAFYRLRARRRRWWS